MNSRAWRKLLFCGVRDLLGPCMGEVIKPTRSEPV